MKNNEKIEIKGSYLNYIQSLIDKSPNFFKYQQTILNSVKKTNGKVENDDYFVITSRQLNAIKNVVGGKLKDEQLRYSSKN